jgi:hypothetical protein
VRRKTSLFDHLVRACEQRIGRIEAERLGSLEVDHQFKFGRKLNRQFARLFTLENAIDIGRGASVKVRNVDPVGGQATARDMITIGIDVGQVMLRCKCNNQCSMNGSDRIRQHQQTAVRFARERADCVFDVRSVSNSKGGVSHAKPRRLALDFRQLGEI